MIDKIKRLLRDDSIFYGLLILLVGTISFGLGKWSAGDVISQDEPASIIFSEKARFNIIDDIERTDTEKVQSGGEEKMVGAYVASKNGSKYHLPWCPGVKQMKEENKVWFASKEEAEAAGYTPAANCKGI